MALDVGSLGSVGSLTRALGLTDEAGLNDSWFTEPLGGTVGNPTGLGTILANDNQREALEGFLDEILGPPDRHTEADERWIPLFTNPDPSITVYAVLEPTGAAGSGTVRLGIGVEHQTGTVAPKVTTRVHVPILHMPRGSIDTRPTDGSNPAWLLLGRPGGRIRVEVEATFTDAAPVAREPFLRGASIGIGIPTGAEDVEFTLELTDLQVPGATTPTTQRLTLDDLDEVGSDLLNFVVGLVRAQIAALDPTDPAFRHIVGLAGALGLRDVAGLPVFPLADLPSRGVAALVTWFESVLTSAPTRTLWLNQLVLLTGGSAIPARNAVRCTLGPATITMGLEVGAGTGGHPTLTPWVELALDTRAGATAVAAVQLLRIDTGSGRVTAIPGLSAIAMFGADGGGPKLITGNPVAGDPGIGSVHVGLSLDDHQRPSFELTLHDVDLPGPHHHDVINLSSPEAAIAAVDTVLDQALSDALNSLGAASALLKILLGVDPPGALSPLSVIDLVRDPLAAIRSYWARLSADTSAMGEALGALRQLLTGEVTVSVPGNGSRLVPWHIRLGPAEANVGLDVWRDGRFLVLATSFESSVDVLDDLRTNVNARLVLARIDIMSSGMVADRVSFLNEVSGAVGISSRTVDPVHADLGGGVSVDFTTFTVNVTWTPAMGLRIEPQGTIAVNAAGPLGIDRIAIPLPTVAPNGMWTFAPDWAEVERLLAHLLRRVGNVALSAVLDLLGWEGKGARLSLGGLVSDPAAALQNWALDLSLNCGHLADTLRPIAWLLSGGTLGAPLGSGSPHDPWRLPLAGASAAPGLAVWTVPGCPTTAALNQTLTGVLGQLVGSITPTPAAAGLILQTASADLPGLAPLVHARTHLGDGFGSLAARWIGSDGLITPPSTSDVAGQLVLTSDAGVKASVLAGFGYSALAASARIGTIALPVIAGAPSAVVHVGCDPRWLDLIPVAQRVDATGTSTARVGSSDAPWFVLVPTVTAASADRTDHDGVAAQADRIAGALAGRIGSVVLVGHGGAGAATVLATATPTVAAITHSVVTVGTPWGPVSTAALHTGLGGDALRLLRAMRPTEVPGLDDEILALGGSAYRRGLDLVERSGTASTAADLPSALGRLRATGIDVHAVFGTLDSNDVGTALAGYLATAIDERGRAASGVGSTDPEELHAGVGLPVFDISLGGVLVGVGATVDLVSVHRAAPRVRPLRAVTVTVRLAVEDGWLVGGPGAVQNELEVRWAEARIHVPLNGSVGHTELILHEARAHNAHHENWIVTGDATGALPEVRILLAEVVARLRVNPDLDRLLTAFGLLREGGLDPGGVDRLLFDPAATMRAAVTGDPTRIAQSIRTLIGATPGPELAPTAFRLATAGASVTVDIASGTVLGTAATTAAGFPATLTLSAGPSGATIDATLGAIHATRGGFRLAAHAGVGGVRLALEHAGPGRSPTTVRLLPGGDAVALSPILIALVPATVAQILTDILRSRIENDRFDEALAALGLLTVPDPAGIRRTSLPYGLMSDPVGWLTRVVNPAEMAVATLDALADLVVPARGSAPGWPLTDNVTLTYSVVGGALSLGAEIATSVTIEARPITMAVAGALRITPAGTLNALLDVRSTIDGYGLELAVGTATPPVRLDLVRPTPLPPITLFPAGQGIGNALVAGATSLVPRALDELIAHRTDAVSLTQQVASVVHEICGALDLLKSSNQNHIDPAKIAAYAAPPGPGALLLSRLPALAATGLASLAQALDPAHMLVVSTLTAPSVRRFDLGRMPVLPATQIRPVSITIDGSATPAVRFGLDVDLGGIGRLVVEEIGIDATGVRVSVRGGPFLLDLGPTTLRPVFVVRAGVTSGSFTRLIGAGLAVDDAGTTSAQVRWTLDATPPSLVAVTTTPTLRESTDTAEIASALLGIAVSIASGLVADQLDTVVTARATALLQNVVFTGASTAIDPGFVHALFHQEELLGRLKTLAWNLATASPGFEVTIDSALTIGLVAEDVPAVVGAKRIGLRVNLPPGKTLVLSDSDPKVEIVVHGDWVNGSPPEGLSVFVLEGTGAALEIVPGVQIVGLGLRFSGATSPLVDLGGMSIDAIEVNGYGEATRSGGGFGVRLKLDGLSVAPAGGAGSNGVANSLMSDVGSASGSARPTFSPSIAVQKAPGDDLGVTLRAGDPPGPWWLIVQRQLGPLYVERIGLGTTEQGGRVTAVRVLFTGGVSMFGLSAQVDQLSIAWLGGDPTDIRNWAVDLMGLAVSADIAGAALSGGLLKTVDGSTISYVGMLIGRFATYGLSVFGGYSDDGHGHASFFVFGGVTGPFGGPPAFFLTGIGGGLGINRGLVIPRDISRFGEFPFIQALDPAARPPDNPMDKLKELGTYFPHQMGNFWFAAGISFTSFSLVDGIAVLAVSFGNGLDINLLGLARLALPRPGAAIVSIELALVAHFSTSEGIFLIQAQLTDNSWLLYEDIRLTGGFAFAFWWKGPLAGQFVLTLGGYHPSFRVPVGYPDVPRLGLVWQISDAIVMKGGSYFALTSEALMAGTDVEVSLDFGWVWAKVSFGAHGIVYFDPFWFEVSAYARISAGIEIDLGWFGTISISISIGAKIKVWGPDFAGHAEFEIGPCTVPVDFGSPRRVEPETLDWGRFVTKYLEDAGGVARALSAITGRGTLPTATSNAAGAPSSDGSAALPFQVFAEFELSITTTIPITTVDAGGLRIVPVVLNTGASTSVGLAPMGAQGLGSVLKVTLLQAGANAARNALLLGRLTANFRIASPSPTGTRFETDSFPLGVWGAPKTLGAAVQALPSTDVVRAGNRVVLVAGISATAIGPAIDYYRVEASRRPLPLHATGATRTAFLKTSRDLNLPIPATAAEALSLAEATLFPDRVNVLADGQHSALARAAYRRDRSAPPRIGSLTDGLARRNGTDGERSIMDRVEQPVPIARPPYVTGLLLSGVGAVADRPLTTVANKRTKRRPAPTVESVHGRLGRVLPVTLTRSAQPGFAKAGTIIATDGAPRTDTVGTTASYSGGRIGAPSLAGLVAGIGAKRAPNEMRARRAPSSGGSGADVAQPGRRLRSGDLVVLQRPDAQLDTDTQRRPSVTIDGSARIVVTAGRIVLDDVVVTNSSHQIQPGASLVGVHADGGADVICAGWTTRSRLARLGTHLAIGTGCTLSVDAAGTSPSLKWALGQEVVDGASEVVTRFAQPVSTIAIVVTGDAPSSLLPAELNLVGARPASDDRGVVRPPIAVALGPSTVLLHEIVRTDSVNGTGNLTGNEATNGGNDTTVRVVTRRGGTYDITGVLGSKLPARELALLLAREGVDAVLSKLLATSGNGAAVSWIPADRPRKRYANRKGKSR